MIRPYQHTDEPALLQLLRLNTPTYFDPSEEADFIDYFANELDLYFVYETKGQLLACGGLNRFPEENLAHISWDMVHPDTQGKGVGKALTQYRIAAAKALPNMHSLVVRTSQHAFGFYEKCGFSTQYTKKDYWAPGFDLYYMTMSLLH